MERKTVALALLLIAACAAIIGGFVMTAHATDTNSTTTSSTSSGAAVTSDSNATNQQLWEMNGMSPGDQGFGGTMGLGMGHGGFMSGVNNLEVSSEYTANVTAVLNADTDIANLIAEGYNVTSINPLVKNVIEGDGTIATQATTAVVTLQNGTSGYATANVDLSQAKVTQIVILTRTVIDKTTS
jgi:hypothetical protein